MARVQLVIVSVTNMLSIKEFLLTYAIGHDLDVAESEPAMVTVEDSVQAGSGSHRPPSRLQAEIERHNDRTMTVVSRSGIETITRCGVCPKTESSACIGLRRLALPYAGHPAYRPEWRI